MQDPPTQIDGFQTNIFSWLDDIKIKKKIFLNFWVREIWYKTFNLGTPVFLWSQSLHIWKIQRVVWFLAVIFKWKWKQKWTDLLWSISDRTHASTVKYEPHMKALILSYFEPEGQGLGILMTAPRPHPFKSFTAFLSEVVEAMWGWWSEKKIIFYIKSPYLRIPKIIDFWIQCL